MLRRITRRVAYWLGLTGSSGGRRRFLRFTFGLRIFLVLLTPLFFALPVRQYGYAATRWYWFAATLAESLGLALLAWRRFVWLTESRWTSWIQAGDLLFVFIVFGATTRPHTGAAVVYSTIVVVGAFQLQTYGPVITTGGLSGIWSGFIAGLFGMIAYPATLLLIGRSWSGLFGPTQIANTINRALAYLFLGIVFGLLRDLVTRLSDQRVKFSDVVHRRIDANRAVERQIVETEAAEQRERLQESYNRELETINRELEHKAYDVLHRRGISNLGLLSQDLLSLTRRATRDLIRPALSGELLDDVQGIAQNLLETLEGLKQIGSGLEPGALPISHVLRFVVVNQKLSDFRRNSHPVAFVVSDDEAFIEQVVLNEDDATALDQIVREGIRNSLKYAAPGEITVRAYQENGSVHIDVADAGPERSKRRPKLLRKEEKPFSSQVGLRDCAARAEERGWTCEFIPSETPDQPGCFKVKIPSGDL